MFPLDISTSFVTPFTFIELQQSLFLFYIYLSKNLSSCFGFIILIHLPNKNEKSILEYVILIIIIPRDKQKSIFNIISLY